MEPAASSTNPEAGTEFQQLIAKVLIKGELSAINGQVFYEVPTTTEIRKQLQVPFFEKLLKQVNADLKEDAEDIWVDARELAVLITEETAKTLVIFIQKFSVQPIALSKAFTSWREFKAFEHVLEKLNVKGSFPDLAKLGERVAERFPVLVLIDVGGSILCRSGEKLPVKRRSGATFCQIKQHYHYYRPGFDHFLARLFTHPRIQLGFYTSIMRKNLMPLLFKIFELKALQGYHGDIFEIFDQSYNSDDVRPGRKLYATKRCLEKVLDNDKVKQHKFTKDNTIMIDSEVTKILDYPENSITVKPYEVLDVMQGTSGHEEILLDVVTYLDGLLSSTESVPDYLNSHRKTGTTIFDLRDFVGSELAWGQGAGASNPDIVVAQLAEQLDKSGIRDQII